MRGTGTLTARRLLACAASVVLGVGALRSLVVEERGLVFIVAALPLMAGALIWNPRLIAQVVSRGCWWCYLVMGVFIATSSAAGEAYRGTFSAVCAAVALLVVGRTGLDGTADTSFQPVAFRGTLVLALVLAIADAVALMSVGVMMIVFERNPAVLGLGILMSLGVVGLVRLRTWGLLLALASNALVATLALMGALPLSHLLQKVFACTAILQLVVPLPMLVTLVRRRAPGPDRWQATRWKAATLGIVVLAAFSVYAGLIHRAPFMR